MSNPTKPARLVGGRIRKKDWEALTTGQPVYTDDIAPENCLIVKPAPFPSCTCPHPLDQYRDCQKGTGSRSGLYLGRRPEKTVHVGRPDLPGTVGL